MKHNITSKIYLFSLLSCLAVTGCTLTVCDEGNVVCMDNQEERMMIYQSDMCEGSRCAISQPQSCQLYRCQGDTFVPIPNGSCPLGSQMINGILSCIPRCEDKPASRCKTDQNQTIIQTCSNDGDDLWQTSSCANSCQFDESSDYEEDGYKAGVCGECKNDMQHYCRFTDDGKTELISCINGTLSSETVEQCPDELQTQCDSGFVFLKNDNNCGSCGHICTGNDNCINGKCEPCDENGYLDYSVNGKNIRAYCIHNAAELKEFHDNMMNSQNYPADNTDKAYIIVGDIEYADSWEPLGTIDQPVEDITLIGLNHKITFKMPIYGKQYAGVFGFVKNSLFDTINIEKATLMYQEMPEKLSFDESDVGDLLWVDFLPVAGGFIARMDNSIIQNSTIHADVNGVYYVGGIVGMMENSIISQSSSSGNLVLNEAETEYCYINTNKEKECITYHNGLLGGITGEMVSSQIDNSHSDTLLTSKNSSSSTGGLVGQSKYSSSILNSYRNESIQTLANELGGLVGYAYSSFNSGGLVIKNSYFSSKNPSDNAVLKMCKINDNNEADCSDNSVTGHNIGGLVGAFDGNGKLQMIGNHVHASIFCNTDCGGFIGSLYDEPAYWTMTNASKGEIMVDGCIKLNNRTNKCLEYIPSNINITSSDEAGGIIGKIITNYQLFVSHLYATVNIKAETVDYHDDSKIGGITGYLNYPTSFTDLNLDISIHANKHSIGGVVGEFTGSELTLSDSNIHLNLNGVDNVGGIAGRVRTNTDLFQIYNSTISGDIECNNNCGGIYGYSDCVYDYVQTNDEIYEYCKWDHLNIDSSNDKYYSLTNLKIKDLTIKGNKGISGAFGVADNSGIYFYNQNILADNLKIYGKELVGGFFGGNYYNRIANYDSVLNNIMIEGEQCHIGGFGGTILGQLTLWGVAISGEVFGKNNQSCKVGGVIGYTSGKKNYLIESFINVFIKAGTEFGLAFGQRDGIDMLVRNSTLLGGMDTYTGSNGGIAGVAGNANSKFSIWSTTIYPIFNAAIASVPKTGLLGGNVPGLEIDNIYYPKQATTSYPLLGSNSTIQYENAHPFTIGDDKRLYAQNTNNTVASLLDSDDIKIKECMVKIQTNENGSYQCIQSPYSQRLSPTDGSLPSFCIPDNQIQKECGSL